MPLSFSTPHQAQSNDPLRCSRKINPVVSLYRLLHAVHRSAPRKATMRRKHASTARSGRDRAVNRDTQETRKRWFPIIGGRRCVSSRTIISTLHGTRRMRIASPGAAVTRRSSSNGEAKTLAEKRERFRTLLLLRRICVSPTVHSFSALSSRFLRNERRGQSAPTPATEDEEQTARTKGGQGIGVRSRERARPKLSGHEKSIRGTSVIYSGVAPSAAVNNSRDFGLPDDAKLRLLDCVAVVLTLQLSTTRYGHSSSRSF